MAIGYRGSLGRSTAFGHQRVYWVVLRCVMRQPSSVSLKVWVESRTHRVFASARPGSVRSNDQNLWMTLGEVA